MSAFSCRRWSYKMFFYTCIVELGVKMIRAQDSGSSQFLVKRW
jgi:hypothetical protein